MWFARVSDFWFSSVYIFLSNPSLIFKFIHSETQQTRVYEYLWSENQLQIITSRSTQTLWRKTGVGGEEWRRGTCSSCSHCLSHWINWSFPLSEPFRYSLILPHGTPALKWISRREWAPEKRQRMEEIDNFAWVICSCLLLGFESMLTKILFRLCRVVLSFIDYSRKENCKFIIYN